MNRIHDQAESFLPPDFPAVPSAHLVWIDGESGEELSIELVAPREFLRDLEAEGFTLRSAQAKCSASQRCRIEAEASN